jgi:hypothetical protein
MTVAEFEAELRRADWFYEYADNFSTYSRGKEQIQRLNTAYQTLKTGPDADLVESLWQQYIPKKR